MCLSHVCLLFFCWFPRSLTKDGRKGENQYNQRGGKVAVWQSRVAVGKHTLPSARCLFWASCCWAAGAWCEDGGGLFELWLGTGRGVVTHALPVTQELPVSLWFRSQMLSDPPSVSVGFGCSGWLHSIWCEGCFFWLVDLLLFWEREKSELPYLP